jgi:hypothetical protein
VSEVKRYGADQDFEYDHYMQIYWGADAPKKEEFVLASDYDTLKAQFDEAMKLLEEWLDWGGWLWKTEIRAFLNQLKEKE